MITRVDISNLRSFRDECSFEVAPITLVYGPNSAGKSTLIKALGLLKQTLGPVGVFSRAERPPLVLEGDMADLGTFRNAVHRHEEDRQLYVGLQFTDPSASETDTYAGLGFDFDESAPAGARQSVAALGEGDTHVRFRRPPDSLKFRLDDSEALMRLLAKHVVADDGGEQPVLTELRQKIAEGKKLEFFSSGFFPALPETNYLDDPEADRVFGTWFEETMYRRVGALDHLLSNLSYLGPLRAAPARFQSLSSRTDGVTHVGATGEHVTRVLVENRDGVLDRVNDWLRTLGIGYSLVVHRVPNAVVATDIGDLVATALVDRSGTAITPQDVGFGISQLLPVIVEALANTNSTICIEQPEIHIHPRLQGDLADLLIEVASERGNQLIIETHSENLILRLLKRVRQKEREWLSAEKISVLYIGTDLDAGVAVPSRLSIGEDGEFTDAWPDGFFDERYEDLFEDLPPIPLPGLPLPPIGDGK